MLDDDVDPLTIEGPLTFPKVWSDYHRHKVLMQYYKYFYKKCPIFDITDDQDEIKAVYCYAKDALQCHVDIILNSKITQGYSVIHPNDVHDIKNIRISTIDDFIEYKIPVGKKILIVRDEIQVILTGDGATFTHVPGAPKPMSFCFIRPIILNELVSQCPQSAKLLVASSYSESDPSLRGIIDEVRKNLPLQGYIASKIKNSCEIDYILIPYQQYAGGDWKWCYNLWNYTISPAGKFGIINVAFWYNGVPYGVHENMYYVSFMNMTDPQYAPSFNNAVKKNGLVLH